MPWDARLHRMPSLPPTATVCTRHVVLCPTAQPRPAGPLRWCLDVESVLPPQTVSPQGEGSGFHSSLYPHPQRAAWRRVSRCDCSWKRRREVGIPKRVLFPPSHSFFDSQGQETRSPGVTPNLISFPLPSPLPLPLFPGLPLPYATALRGRGQQPLPASPATHYPANLTPKRAQASVRAPSPGHSP